MNIRRISTGAIISISLIFSNLGYINATNDIGTNTDEKSTTKNIQTYSTSKYKKIELNKTYKHEIRNEPYDKSYDDNLYIEFELKQDGYITFNKSNLYTNDGDINIDEDYYRFILGNSKYENNSNTIRDFFIDKCDGDWSYKIGLPKGVYRIVIDPNFKVTEDSYINYSINFEPKNIVDLEPNDKKSDYISQIKFNQVYEGIFDKKNDYDRFMFNNQSKRDIEIKINFDENIKDEIYENRRQTYLVISDKNDITIENKSLLNLSTDENGFISFKLNRLPKGEYYFRLENGSEGKAQVEYTFELVVDELSYIDEIKGIDRYETAGLIADKQEYDTAILVNSTNSLADGLSASGLAGAVNAPILLTQKDSIPLDTQKRLEGIKKIYLIGLENAISKNIEDNLKSKGIEVKRLGGSDRYQTSYQVAKEIASIKEIDKILLVNGYKGEADAMSVSSVASRDGVPIILTNGEDITFETNGIETYVIGSTGVMSKKIEDKTNATRLGGIDRFDTNKKVIKHFYGQPTEFYLSKSYQLVDALTGSPLAKKYPIVLVENGSDKTILEGAKKITALGGIDKGTIQQCIDAANGNL